MTSHNVIGTGDLGFNIFIKPLPSWMPDEKDLSPLSWHKDFWNFIIYSLAQASYSEDWTMLKHFLNTSLLLSKKSIIPKELSSLFPVMLFSCVQAVILVPVYRLLQEHWLQQMKKHLL